MDGALAYAFRWPANENEARLLLLLGYTYLPFAWARYVDPMLETRGPQLDFSALALSASACGPRCTWWSRCGVPTIAKSHDGVDR